MIVVRYQGETLKKPQERSMLMARIMAAKPWSLQGREQILESRKSLKNRGMKEAHS
jgi:hypothetical protein